MISGTLSIEPVPKGRPRLGRHGVFTPPKTKAFESSCKFLLKGIANRSGYVLQTGPLRLTLEFFLKCPTKPKDRNYPIVKPDLDNLVKAFCDAANGILWADDSQVVQITTSKLYAPHGAKGSIRFTLELLV